MLDSEIHDAAEELGRALRGAPAVAAYRAPEAAVEADPAAVALLNEMRSLQTAVVEAQRRGEQPAPATVDALRRCQAEVRASDTVMAHLRTTNEMKTFLPGVATEIGRALGTDYARLIAPTSC